MTGPIVVTTDFSARTDRAIDRALMLGAQWSMPVSLVHAASRRERETLDQAALDQAMRNVLPEGVEGVEEVAFVYPEGAPPRAIAATADELAASIIIMGPARYNSLGDYFLGTAVDYALRYCDQPILIVKQRPHGPYRTIVVATDLSEPSAKALHLALDWFPEASFHLAHACHVPFDAWQRDARVKHDVVAQQGERLDEFVDRLGLSASRKAALGKHVAPGSAHEVVGRVIRETGADLAVIGSHGESGFRHATIGSMANALLETTPCDTLMVTTRN